MKVVSIISNMALASPMYGVIIEEFGIGESFSLLAVFKRLEALDLMLIHMWYDYVSELLNSLFLFVLNMNIVNIVCDNLIRY